jgi:uncharacterized membrane protein
LHRTNDFSFIEIGKIMKIKFWFLIFTIISILMVASACGSGSTSSSGGGTTATQAPTLDGQALVQERCTVCHSIDRIQSASKTADEWKTTVDRMIGKGAQLNADEEAAVIEFLTKTQGK